MEAEDTPWVEVATLQVVAEAAWKAPESADHDVFEEEEVMKAYSFRPSHDSSAEELEESLGIQVRWVHLASFGGGLREQARPRDQSSCLHLPS
jgi:hypothetical protein